MRELVEVTEVTDTSTEKIATTFDLELKAKEVRQALDILIKITYDNGNNNIQNSSTYIKDISQ